jgi:hypothetical protein
MAVVRRLARRGLQRGVIFLPPCQPLRAVSAGQPSQRVAERVVMMASSGLP